MELQCNGETHVQCCMVYFATADEAEAYMFYRFFFVFFVFFCFFSVRHKNTRQPFSGTAERIFMKLLPNDSGESLVSNVVPPPGEWRMLMICIIYAMTLVQSPEGAIHGGCVIKS